MPWSICTSLTGQRGQCLGQGSTGMTTCLVSWCDLARMRSCSWHGPTLRARKGGGRETLRSTWVPWLLPFGPSCPWRQCGSGSFLLGRFSGRSWHSSDGTRRIRSRQRAKSFRLQKSTWQRIFTILLMTRWKKPQKTFLGENVFFLICPTTLHHACPRSITLSCSYALEGP